MGIEIRIVMEGFRQDGSTNKVKDLKASIPVIGQATITKLRAKLCAYARLYVQLLMCCNVSANASRHASPFCWGRRLWG
jgi:hypothetical protein